MLYDRTAAPFRRSRRRRPPARGSTALPLVICLAVTALYAATAPIPNAGAAGPPAAVAPPTAAAANWSAWTPIAGPSFLSPSVALNSAAGTLEVACVGLDLGVRHIRVSGTSPAPFSTGSPSFLPPMILSD